MHAQYHNCSFLPDLLVHVYFSIPLRKWKWGWEKPKKIHKSHVTLAAMIKTWGWEKHAWTFHCCSMIPFLSFQLQINPPYPPCEYSNTQNYILIWIVWTEYMFNQIHIKKDTSLYFEMLPAPLWKIQHQFTYSHCWR